MSNSEKARQLHAELERGIDALLSSDDWKRALSFASRFHRYSFGNVLLIAAQRPDATMVAGFHRWLELGRHVRKGEKGIGILAPLSRLSESADEETGEVVRTRVLRGFRVVHVFDVSQTEGDPVPDLMRPALLTSDEGAWGALAQLVVADGFHLERGACDGANGVTFPSRRVVRVRDDIAPAQATKTLAHELAHVRLHVSDEYAMSCRGIAEVEAESVAYIVCAALGIDSADYSLKYVGHWSGGKRETVTATGERVVRCAGEILDQIEHATTDAAPDLRAADHGSLTSPRFQEDALPARS